jgi:hypothetical protein
VSIAATARRGAAVSLLTAWVAAAGCVTTWKYDKPGVDETQTRRDFEACLDRSRVARVPRPIELTGGAVTSFPYEGVDPQRLDDCMTARGYTRIDP